MGHGHETLTHGIYHATAGLIAKAATADIARDLRDRLVAGGEDAAALTLAPTTPDAPFPPATPEIARLYRALDVAQGFDPDRD